MASTERLVNTFDQLCRSGGGVAICPGTSAIRGPGPYTHWSLLRVVNGQSVETDSKSAWYHHGAKVFYFMKMSRQDGDAQKLTNLQAKAAALTAAQAYVAKHFGYTGAWVRNRMGDYVPVDVNRQFTLPKKDDDHG